MAKSKKVKKNKIQSNNEVPLETNVEEQDILVKEAFSGWPVILGWAAMLIFTFHACTHMVAAGDTWVAMACGRHFVNHGVDTVEPFSANSHKPGPTLEEVQTWPRWAQWITDKVGIETVRKWHPTGWIDQNWLTQVIFYKLVPESSYADGLSFTSNALVYWKFAIYIITIVCVYYTSRLLGVNPSLAAVFSCFALFIGRSFLDIRPAGFSNVLAAVFILILTLSVYKNKLFIWLIVPLTIFWCNVHGGYIYIYIMLIPFIGIHFLQCLNKKWTAIVYNVLAWPFLLIVIRAAIPDEASGEEIQSSTILALFLFTLLLGVLDIVLIFAKDKLVCIDWKGVCHTTGAFIVSFLAAIIFNPFHLTNLTHTFVISVSKNAERWRDIHEWHPAFDWTNPVGTAIPFLIMYIILWLSFVAWIFAIIYMLRSKASNDKNSRKRKIPEHILWPRFDIALVIISILTVYMAIRSRRFIPIAGIAACPLIAFINQELIRFLLAAVSIRKFGTITSFIKKYVLNSLELNIAGALIIVGLWQLLFGRWLFFPIPDDPEHKLQPRIILFVLGVILAYNLLFVSILFWPFKRKNEKSREQKLNMENIFPKIIFGARVVIFAFVIGFGIWFSMTFKRVYLDPWPNDAKYSSVFMRMTASDAKPFYTMKFINDNKLEGKMFNYWTEGGFIAWGQEPDPNTGRTPLQLFMDGRAQAAYNRQAFDEWSYILAGGRITYDILLRSRTTGRSVSNADYKNIGDFVSGELKKHDVWVMLMPSSVFNDPEKSSSYYAIKALEDFNDDWRLAFFNDRQKLLVDITTQKGKELYDGIETGDTVYPDEFHSNLIKAHKLLKYEPTLNDKINGLQLAMQAFNAGYSPAAMMEIISNAIRFSELTPSIKKFCEDYVESFSKNRDTWIKQDGYRLKVESARYACFRLVQAAELEKDQELIEIYSNLNSYCLSELKRINDEKRW